MSQAPKFPKARKHKAKAAIKPTWPATKDQRKQSRPVIVLRPMRYLSALLLAKNFPDENGVRSLTSNQRELLRSIVNAPRSVIERVIALNA